MHLACLGVWEGSCGCRHRALLPIMSESVHNQWLQCRQSSSCIRDIYPLNSQGREDITKNWTGGKSQSFGSFFFLYSGHVILKEVIPEQEYKYFCSFLLQLISWLVHSSISITVSMQIVFCGCLWHKSNASTAETLMSTISIAWITLLLKSKTMNCFSNFPFDFFFFFFLWLKDEETLEETQLSSPAGNPDSKKSMLPLENPWDKPKQLF